MKMPFQPGDQVTTHFYPVQKNRRRTVIRCYRSIDCPSGWLVDTKDDSGKLLKALDAKWYQLMEMEEAPEQETTR
ncbi:hypothetical protein [Endozoicomonas sp. YOMI1]|uniref:hypothetical protein n=1 Tax=Endozoicomonas sp. YOMI1 TaxID=2828739 RepID=UPI0021492271|nr:hypothetical protein [Endozoicomonas sp. YOMI1]